MRHVLAVTVAVVALAACGRLESPRAAPPRDTPARDPKWKDHMGDIPFVVGREPGMRQAAASGRTPMYFFTATW